MEFDSATCLWLPARTQGLKDLSGIADKVLGVLRI